MSSFGDIIKDIQIKEGFDSRKDMASALNINPTELSFYVTGGRRTPDYVVIELSEMKCMADYGVDLKTLLLIRNFYHEYQLTIDVISELMRNQFINNPAAINTEPIRAVIHNALTKTASYVVNKHGIYNMETVEQASLLITAQEVIGTIFIKENRMSVESFGSFDEMMQRLEDNNRIGREWVNDAPPMQKALLDGKQHYAIQVHEELDLVVFADIMDLDEYHQENITRYSQEALPGELDAENEKLHEQTKNGYVYTRAYSAVEPYGELGSLHASNLLPINKESFELAKSVNWNIPVSVVMAALREQSGE